MEPIIKAEHISFSYPADEDTKPRKALSDVSLEIEKGSFTAILGRNGSGKSTLAKLMCMILFPDEGKLFIEGRDMTAEGIGEDDIYEARKNVGMVFQNPDNQIVATIVEEDVAFGPENLGVPSAEIRRRVDEALETVGMKEYARHATQRLSGGQKQRIAIAGVLAMHRDIIIFDESTAMLDPRGRKEVMDTILRLNRQEGITVILITHYMTEAALADKVVVMSDGTVADTGTPGEVFSRVEEMRERGLDVPQTTELLWRVKNAGYDVRLDIFDPEECAKEIARAFKIDGRN
ncbi:MAG: energy-coupling factor transporter ATPase [Clostridia bacterium]|nr:energy-coupling factor transporter ATPase [Clostridia bacterium]